MKTIHLFITRHPYWACLFTAVITIIATSEIMFHLMRVAGTMDTYLYIALALAIGLALWAGRRIAKHNKTITLILTMSLLASHPLTAAEPPAEPPAEPLPALIIAGLAVLIIGSVVSCRIIRQCHRIAAGRTNTWPEELPFTPAGATSYGATFSWSESGYCIGERKLDPHPSIVLTLQVTIRAATNVTMTTTAHIGDRYTQTYEAFLAELETHGLTFGVTPGPEASYSRQRHPSDPDQVPISIDWSTHTVRIDPGGITLTLSRSEDLTHWQPVLRLEAPPGGTPIEIPEVSETTTAFYRLTVQ